MKIKECPLCDKERLRLVLSKKAGDCPGCFEKNNKDEIILKKPCGKCKYRDGNISITKGVPWPYLPYVPAAPTQPSPWCPSTAPGPGTAGSSPYKLTTTTGTSYWTYYTNNTAGSSASTSCYPSADSQISAGFNYQQQALMNAPFDFGTK
jgi:hypothetical protein